MELTLKTWNSLNINDAAIYTAYIPMGQMANLTQNAVTVNRAADFPFLSTTVLPSHTFAVGINIVPGYNIATARELLKKYFNITDRQRHDLVAWDTANGNTPYYLTGFPVRIINDKKNTFTVILQVEYPYWRQVTASVDSWDISVTADSEDFTNSGNINAKPIFTFTPTITKTAGLKYWRFVSIYNNMDRSFVAPLEITNGGLDVQTLIDANKMQADGDDFLVWRNGAFADRWLSGMDSDSDPAKCWENETLMPRHEGVTNAAFDSDDLIMTFSQTKANLSFLQGLKVRTNKTLLIESEHLTYVDSDIDLNEYTISNLTRGAKNTSVVAHASTLTVRQIENELYLIYGDSDLTTPDIDNNYKPIFALTSTNASWSWVEYFDNRSNRPGMWKPEVLSSRSGLSYNFTDSDPESSANPSNILGLAMIGGQSSSNLVVEEATVDWLFSHPAGITNISYTGAIYSVDGFPAAAGLQYLLPNTVWNTAQNEVAPADSETWEPITPRNLTLPATYETVRFALDGTLNAVAGDQAMMTIDDVVASFDSDNLPTITVGSETTVNFFDFKFTNNTTGEYIKVKCPCPVNTVLTIDCENKRAYLSNGTKVNIVFSSDRSEWLDLQPGVNNLQFDDVGTAGVHVNVTHRDRIL